MKNPFSIALAVALISLVGSIQSEASTLTPTDGQLGTNPQNESFGVSGITCQYYCGAGNENGFGLLGGNTFSVTITGTGLQPLDITIPLPPGINVDQGFEITISGVTPPVNISFSPNPAVLDYMVNPGTYTISFLGELDYPYTAASYEGTITAGAPIPGTPLPAALPLFATGLGAMGLLGWRRKRKNTTAIAAA